MGCRQLGFLTNSHLHVSVREAHFSEANDLAAQNPAKLKELQDLFMKEVAKNHVLPIDDRRAERLNPTIAGRPDLMGARTSLTVIREW